MTVSFADMPIPAPLLSFQRNVPKMQEYDRADTGAIDVRKACVLKEGIAPTGNAFKVV